MQNSQLIRSFLDHTNGETFKAQIDLLWITIPVAAQPEGQIFQPILLRDQAYVPKIPKKRTHDDLNAPTS